MQVELEKLIAQLVEVVQLHPAMHSASVLLTARRSLRNPCIGCSHHRLGTVSLEACRCQGNT